MFEWSDEHQMIREAVKRFVDEEIRPHVDELEHGDLPPYDILRKLFATFGMDAMARDRFKKQIEREKSVAAAVARGEEPPPAKEARGDDGGESHAPAFLKAPTTTRAPRAPASPPHRGPRDRAHAGRPRRGCGS